jgi:hypothetical protein
MNFFSFRRLWYFSLLFSFCITPKLYSQSIAPYILNNGGGSGANLDWSMGESVSIAHFATSNYFLNTGVLQPMTNEENAFNENGAPLNGHQITIGPNPTISLVHFKGNFTQTGKLSIQIIDSKSSILLTHEAGNIIRNYEKDIFLYSFPAGIYFVKVYFKPTNGLVKTGIYKIIKL